MTGLFMTGLRAVLLLLVAAIAVLLPASVCCAEALTAAQVIQKAVERTNRTEALSTNAANYSYTKITVTEELDADGKVTERKEKVYQVHFENGARYSKLISVNGKIPESADAKKQADNEASVRQLTGKNKSARTENHDNFLTPERVARFDFKIEAQEAMNNRMAYKIAFQPKNPPPPVRKVIDKLLNRVSGTIWIDAQEFEVARADIQLRSEVNLLGGVIGSLKKFVYTMTRTRVAEGVWLNTSSRGDFQGRKLIDAMRVRTKSEASNFKPMS